MELLTKWQPGLGLSVVVYLTVVKMVFRVSVSILCGYRIECCSKREKKCNIRT